MFSTQETLIPFCASMDCGKQQPYSSYAVYYPLEVKENLGIGEEDNEEDLMVKKSVNNMIYGNSQWAKSDSFPFNFAVNTLRWMGAEFTMGFIFLPGRDVDKLTTSMNSKLDV